MKENIEIYVIEDTRRPKNMKDMAFYTMRGTLEGSCPDLFEAQVFLSKKEAELFCWRHALNDHKVLKVSISISEISN